MFGIGDLIVHPMHGAGVIDDVIQEKVAGAIKEFLNIVIFYFS